MDIIIKVVYAVWGLGLVVICFALAGRAEELGHRFTKVALIVGAILILLLVPITLIRN